MQRETIDKSNELLKLIESNAKAVEKLTQYAESGKTLYTKDRFPICYGEERPFPIPLEPWEIRLIIHNKKQRIKALEKELEEL